MHVVGGVITSISTVKSKKLILSPRSYFERGGNNRNDIKRPSSYTIVVVDVISSQRLRSVVNDKKTPTMATWSGYTIVAITHFIAAIGICRYDKLAPILTTRSSYIIVNIGVLLSSTMAFKRRRLDNVNYSDNEPAALSSILTFDVNVGDKRQRWRSVPVLLFHWTSSMSQVGVRPFRRFVLNMKPVEECGWVRVIYCFIFLKIHCQV